MAISLRLPEEDTKIIKIYTKMHGITVSEFARQAMLDRIEDEYDLETIREYEEAVANGTLKTYSHEECWSKAGL